jgi:lysophospholipase L1-like esterase
MAYPLAPMTASTRPHRSRAGFVLFLALLALGVWEIVGRVAMPGAVTPLKFAGAAWTVAGGGSVAGAGAPSDEAMKTIAYRPLPYLNYGLKPNWTRTNPDKPDAPVKTSNSLGFRGREVEQPKPAGRYRIACLGGSTTYDDGVGDAETYPLKLEEFLRAARPDLDIEVVNCGVPSYTTAESVPNLAFRVLDLQPDAIVLYEGINDWRVRPYKNFDPAYFHYRKVWDGGTQHWETGEGEMVGGINPLIQYRLPSDNGNAAENSKRNGPGAFKRNLQTMCGIAAAHGVKAVLVTNVAADTSAYSPPEQYKNFLAGLAEHNGVVKDVAQEQGALLVDLAASYPHGEVLFTDDVHNNPRGSEIKARIIADVLAKDLLP